MLLSIIAAQPPGTHSQAYPEDELAVQRVREVLEMRRSDTHRVEPAPSLGEIRRILKDNPLNPKDHLQIIGHGTPGMLALGYFWTGTYSEKGDTFALDGELNAYGVLDGMVPSNASVSLIGCSIGEDRMGLAQCDGPTLIFDLSRLWSCPVSASVGWVGPDDFDSNGLFMDVSPETKALRIVTAKDRSVSYVPPPMPLGGHSQRLAKIKVVDAVPILGPKATSAQIEQITHQLAALGEIAVFELPYKHHLALPEVVARLADGRVARFYAHSSIIRVTDPATKQSQSYTPQSVLELQQAFRRALLSAL